MIGAFSKELSHAQAAGGRIMESRNRVVSAPKEHGKRVTLLAMTRSAPARMRS